MIVALVGMSGVGKSHHAAALTAHGFVHHDIDAAIAARLDDLCAPLPGERPVETVGRWMGMPWQEGRLGREQRYLALEAELTERALDRSDLQENHVIDTTGSVVYLPEPTLERLQHGATVVHLRTAPSDVDAMLERYLSEPKPVIWGDAWAPRDGESNEATLRRCYPALLRWRGDRYRRLAHHTADGAGLSTDRLRQLFSK